MSATCPYMHIPLADDPSFAPFTYVHVVLYNCTRVLAGAFMSHGLPPICTHSSPALGWQVILTHILLILFPPPPFPSPTLLHRPFPHTPPSTTTALTATATATDAKPALLGSSLGCAIIWSYVELYGQASFSKFVFVDQAPSQVCAVRGGRQAGRQARRKEETQGELGGWRSR